MNRRLQPDELTSALAQLDGWRLEDGRLCREFVFSNFVEAIGFMMRSAIRAEQMNHHPEWRNVYRTVRVALVTHDLDGISQLDVDLAAAMNELAAS